jgi:hypothetical protein
VNVDRTVAVASSGFHRLQQVDLQVNENKEQIYRVKAGDPLCPRRFPVKAGSGCFQVLTFQSVAAGLLKSVEAC